MPSAMRSVSLRVVLTASSTITSSHVNRNNRQTPTFTAGVFFICKKPRLAAGDLFALKIRTIYFKKGCRFSSSEEFADKLTIVAFILEVIIPIASFAIVQLICGSTSSTYFAGSMMSTARLPHRQDQARRQNRTDRQNSRFHP